MNHQKKKHMKYRQMIEIGTHIQGIFSLPCVESVRKDEKGNPFYEVYAQNAKWAVAGQWLAEDYEGVWHVLSAAEAVREGGGS